MSHYILITRMTISNMKNINNVYIENTIYTLYLIQICQIYIIEISQNRNIAKYKL